MMKQRNVVLVTGGSGLVGSSIAYVLKTYSGLNEHNDEYVFLSSRDGDLTHFEQTSQIFDRYKPKYVINLAAKVGGLYANMRNNKLFYEINKRINENVLKAANDFNVIKCISCLSTCVFPDGIELPLVESKIHLGPPHESNQGYSLAKRHVDLLNKEYDKINSNTLFTAIIPTNIYGKFDNFDLENAHVIPGLIHKAFLAIERANEKELGEATVVVSGSGAPLRQFIYGPDLARIIIWCLHNYADHEPMIICPGETDEYSISYVADIICAIFSQKFNMRLRTIFDTTQDDGQFRKTASNEKLRKFMPGFEFTPLEIGLKQVIDWFCEVYPNLKKGSDPCL